MSSRAANSNSADARWIGRLVVLMAVGATVYVAAIVWAGSAQTLRSIGAIGVVAFAIGALAAFISYLFRFARWQMILARLGHRLPAGFSFRVYLAGLALTTSPAKLGETLRSALLLPHGVPLPHSLAAFFADRLADVIGVALLGAVAGLLAGERQPALEAIAAIVFIGAMIAVMLMHRPSWSRVLHAIDKTTYFGRFVAALAAPVSAWAQVWSMRRAPLYALAAFVAFGIQGLVFAGYVAMVAPQVDAAQCVAIFASSTLIGAASMIPGGLGAMEAAMVVQLGARGVAAPDAIAAVVITRASTLWFGMILGATTLLGLAGARAPRTQAAQREPK